MSVERAIQDLTSLRDKEASAIANGAAETLDAYKARVWGLKLVNNVISYLEDSQGVESVDEEWGDTPDD